MAIVNVKPVKNLKALIYYVSKSKPHTPNEERVLDYKANLCSLNSAYKSFNFTNNFMGRKKKIPAYSVIKSWSPEELNPSDPESISLAIKSISTLIEEQFGKDRQYIVVCQKDGTGGKIHTHGIVCNTSTTTGKAISGNDKYWKYVAFKSDEIDKRLGIKNLNKDKIYEKDGQLFSTARDTPEVETLAEREIKKRNEEIRKENKNNIIINRMIENSNDMAKKMGVEPDKLKPLKEIKKTTYLWKDDLKERIKQSKNSSDTLEQFINKLNNNGVNVNKRKSKQANTNGYKYTYSFIDEDNKNRKIRENKLGSNYSYKTLSEEFEMVYKKKVKETIKEKPKKDIKENVKENLKEDDKNKPNYSQPVNPTEILNHNETDYISKDIKSLKTQNKAYEDNKSDVDNENNLNNGININDLEKELENKIENDNTVKETLRKEKEEAKRKEKMRRKNLDPTAYLYDKEAFKRKINRSLNEWDLEEENENDGLEF